MKLEINKQKIVQALCSFLFLMFAFSYLYFYQYGIIAKLQYTLSDGQTRYDPLTGALVITVVLYVINKVMERWIKTPHPYWLNLIPSASLLIVLCGGDGLWWRVVLLAIANVVLFAVGRRLPPSRNLFALLIILCCVCVLGTSGKQVHRKANHFYEQLEREDSLARIYQQLLEHSDSLPEKK